ncbi:lantibiotic dehydratase [Micromonospora sp. WMMA1363]|uniref:lantibiotic dehydratase n=1 Tax=Micromonospora sp. WMMA1363 TaxID=3053985 RepID=UPI00259D2B07|nr:lantibiotic dehydratase [Micromonospora sp. WMMA1363]MDM4719458.1 lantibiotic dehydratase [Micromonospora sp. WMMA1363]
MASLTWTVRAGRGQLSVEVLPWSLLRATGFPVRMLAGLAAPALLDVTDRVCSVERDIAAVRTHFLDECWPTLRAAVRDVEPRQRSLRALQSCRRRVEAGARLDERETEILATTGLPDWAAGWNALVATHEEHLATARSEFDTALYRARRYTAGVADSAPFQHAVFVSNPGFFRSALHTPPLAHPAWRATTTDADLPRGLRRRLDTLHRYARRFATKCETVSFFGPVLFSRLSGEQEQAVLVEAPAGERVVVEASAWLVEQLRQQAARDTPLRRQRAWRSPLFRQPGSDPVLERVVDGRRFAVAAPALALWQAASAQPGGRLAELVGTVVADQSDEHLAGLVKALGPALTVSPWRLPATELHALTRLAAEHPTAVVVELAEARDKYAEAGWPHRAGQLTAAQAASERAGGDVSRGGGRHYADRELFHEDRSSPVSERVSFGAPIAARLRQVTAAVFPLAFLAALLAREDARDALRATLRGAPAPLAALAARDIPARTDRRDRLDAVLRRLVEDAVSGRVPVGDRPPVVHLDGQLLDRALAPLWDTVSYGPADACLPSPDVMVTGPDPATGTWLLSELHDDCSSVFGGLERPLHSDPDGLWADFVQRVRRTVPPETAATIVSRRRSAHVTPELPGVAIELSGLSDKEPDDVVPIAEATVPPSGDAVLVDGRARLLWPGDLSSTLHRAVSRPALGPVSVDLGAYTPRIVVDGVVLQRARWRLRLPERTGDAFAQWLAVQRIRVAHGLPRHAYVRHPAEPKPLYVDFADPLSVLDIARLPADDVVVSEMLPTPDGLWWRVDDQPHCAEIRLGCLVRPLAATVADDAAGTTRDRQ